MPPKAKFTREEIVSAALSLIRRGEIGALTSRSLGAELGSSSRPIFTVFDSMEEVMKETVNEAKKIYASYIDKGLHSKGIPAFKGVGMQYILFAIKEPKLFQLLFMGERVQGADIACILPLFDDNYPAILNSVVEGYGVTGEQADAIYRHLWIYSHGIAVLAATNICSFTAEEIGKMLTEVFLGVFRQIKGV